MLTGLAEICGAPDKVVDITVAIDKLDKIGLEAVLGEIREKGLSDSAISVVEQILALNGSVTEKLAAMRSLFGGQSASGIVSETGLRGLDELEELFGLISAAGVCVPVEMDLSLARGLNYYTGAIFEVKALDWEIGSISGGGRYDNLTGIFGLPDMSGVGISFGADRIYDVLKGLDKFPAGLRSRGISVEIYPESSKLKKQFDHCDRKSIPFLSICGADEAAAGTVQIKNLASGEQRVFAKDDLDGIVCFLGK